jgi:iron-sulfur cluster assembly protein/iron-sulfur cluster insertion protein
MVTLTPRAAAQVRTLQAGLGDPHKLLRIFVENGGCSGMQYGMSFDSAKAGDETLESEGVRFLIDAQSFGHMTGSSVDFDDGLHGKGFEIKNPRAKSTCGCGKSFN